jgi:SAM-dependent methyltransferase
VLDLGCGTGYLLHLLQAGAATPAAAPAYTGVDASAASLGAARAHFGGGAARWLQADLSDLGALDRVRNTYPVLRRAGGRDV